jgi:hypothetical protein
MNRPVYQEAINSIESMAKQAIIENQIIAK